MGAAGSAPHDDDDGARPPGDDDLAAQRRRAALGTAAFLVVTPGTVAGLIPWLLTQWQVASPLAPGPVRALGAVLVAVGGYVLGESFVRFVVEGLGTPAPFAPTRRLVVGGWYRYVRNPMYVAVLAIVLGQWLLLGGWLLAVYALGYWATVAAFVRFYEEPRLAERYGEQYSAYRGHVRAWWPRLRPYTAEV